MWIFSVQGFYSIVKKEDGYHVRARTKQDLLNLKKWAGLNASVLKSFPGSDYAWRMILQTEAELQTAISSLGRSINYPNFKNAVAQRPDQRNKTSALAKVWATMANLQDLEHEEE
jgi:hypothetical protein